MTSNYDIGSEMVGSSIGFPSTWDGLRKAMNLLLANSMAGLPFTGSEVCGNSIKLIDEELCVRWYQLAAIMPIFRIHASKVLGQFSSLAQIHMKDAVELYVNIY